LPRISGDETQLLQLFQNLLGNALKFARPGVTPRIHLSGEQRDGFWEFRVEDNGIGIPAEYRERIFGMFQRLHARDEYPGTGIGLTICRTVVERHGGRIWAEDAAGSGTTFRFTLPSDPALLPAVEYGAALSDTDRIGAI
jgi:signal transduction histidine kinase